MGSIELSSHDVIALENWQLVKNGSWILWKKVKRKRKVDETVLFDLINCVSSNLIWLLMFLLCCLLSVFNHYLINIHVFFCIISISVYHYYGMSMFFHVRRLLYHMTNSRSTRSQPVALWACKSASSWMVKEKRRLLKNLRNLEIS